jgi:BR serine/threonine kinase
MLHAVPLRGLGRSAPTIPGHAIGKLLGRGASASVYLVVSHQTGAREACKCIPKSSVGSAHGARRVVSEILALKALAHPSIVALHSVLEDEAHYFVLVEYCEGGTLEHQIASKRSLSESLSREVFVQIMGALAYCHSRSIAHRDLKPSNILVTAFPSVKISDFGLAGLAGRGGLMTTLCGTIGFLAPEVFSGLYDALAADVWSAGVLLYAMLTGRIPWRCRNQQELIREAGAGPPGIPCLSAHCNDLLRRMIEPEPARRLRAAQVLEHAWLKGAEPAAAISAAPRPALPALGARPPAQDQAKRRKNTGRLKLTFDDPSE